MNILIIGATGQIGYALARRLATTSHTVTVLVRDGARLGFAAGVRVIRAPAFDADVFAQALAGQDLVVYGIGLPEQYVREPDTFEEVNHRLFARFLQALQASPVRRLVYISTYEVFEPVQRRIRESHAVADPAGLSPYFAAMTRAYRLAVETAANCGLTLTTIHPAAVYGGRDTGDGVTHVIENVLNRRVLQIPTILKGSFPVVHVDSLADAIVRAFDHAGAFIVSEGMTSLKDIALAVRAQAPTAFVPPVVPVWMAYAAIGLLERIARWTGTRPIMSVSQLDFVTKGDEPLADRAVGVLKWQPRSLADGVAQYLRDRSVLL
ncbi:MAG: NAD-dependent epimerase/dehydratase family protein [Burkholderiaceae bacterium]